MGLGLVCLFGFSSSVAILSKAAQVQPDGFAKKNLIFNAPGVLSASLRYLSEEYEVTRFGNLRSTAYTLVINWLSEIRKDFHELLLIIN